jgi:hypothetical protein
MKLFPHEALTFTDLEQPNGSQISDDAINQKYKKGDVRIVTEQARYPLNSIVGLVRSGDYELNPEFQRRRRWSPLKQSRLIESFIMNVPIPPIFLYEVRFSKYEVMDGLQRLTAIYDFYTDKLVLEGLVEWAELNGRRYSELPTLIKDGVNRRYLSSIILLQETAKSEEEAMRLKQLVFERLNSGGVKLEPQESRNAIYNGPLNQLCISLARNQYFCKTWGIPEPTEEELDGGYITEALLQNESYRKMEDAELVLRFFAYRQRLANPKGALKDYLDKFLKYGNNFPPEVLTSYSDLFNRTIELVYETLGHRAFWLWRPRNQTNWNWFSRPALTAYEPIMHVFSQYIDKAEAVIRRRSQFRRHINQFYETNYSSFGGRSTTNISSIIERNNLVEGFVNEIMSLPDES